MRNLATGGGGRSTVCSDEGGEEFAEGLAQPLLKKLTYDPAAVYDDKWLKDTLYDSAVAAALGGLGGGVDVGTKAATDTQSLAKQENPVPQPVTEPKPIRVGRVTTIQRPYTGPTPVQIQKSEAVPVVPEVSVENAENNIQLARQEERANGGKGFKTFLTKLSEKTFKKSSGVPVSGMTFEGKPYLVEIGNNVPGKVISDKNISGEKLAVLDVLPEIVRNAEYVGSGDYVQHHTKQKLTVRFDYFETEAEIGGKPYIVSFDVEVFPNQNNYRTHRINKIELSPSSNADPGPSARRK